MGIQRVRADFGPFTHCTPCVATHPFLRAKHGAKCVAAGFAPCSCLVSSLNPTRKPVEPPMCADLATLVTTTSDLFMVGCRAAAVADAAAGTR
jgi:hypothetical protein